MNIRDAKPEEYDAIGSMTERVYVEMPGSRVGPDYAAELRDVAGRAQSTDIVVAVEPDGTLLGALAFTATGGPLAELAGPGDAEFRMLAVAESARRRGVGRALVEECVRRAEAHGCRRLVLSSGEWMGPAHRMYEQMGFQRTPETDWEPVPGMLLLTYALPL